MGIAWNDRLPIVFSYPRSSLFHPSSPRLRVSAPSVIHLLLLPPRIQNLTSTPSNQHRHKAQGQTARCAVLTISDTRIAETDSGGKTIIELLRAAGHTVTDYTLVKDEPTQIQAQLNSWLTPPNSSLNPQASPLDLIITTGGTGIASRDTTVEVVRRLLDKELEGFGELFRMLSYQEVGPAAMLSRAVAGLANQTLIFTLPGSPNAVKLAMEKLIIPELPHMVWERGR
jgi:molybdopterin adenylyltransferase